MMETIIGGYFELELRKGEPYHKDAISLNSARNCFEYVLLARGYRKVFIPYYTCEVMLQPLNKHHISYEFYSINEQLEPQNIISLKADEAFLYTNYFGLKQACVEKLSTIYGHQLIVDNAQAFYAPRILGIDTFYSPRKFFGVADGGYLYTDCLLDEIFSQDSSFKRMQHLLQRIDEGAEAGYLTFRKNDNEIDNQPIRSMSSLTSRILSSVDYDDIQRRRVINYEYFHKQLGTFNRLHLKRDNDAVPMVYPYYTDRASLRARLIKEKIFVATYWSNVLKWCKDGNQLERYFVDHIIPLPIDQRYINVNIKKIINLIV